MIRQTSALETLYYYQHKYVFRHTHKVGRLPDLVISIRGEQVLRIRKTFSLDRCNSNIKIHVFHRSREAIKSFLRSTSKTLTTNL